MRRSARPTAVDLFSGCGGLTLGLKRAGFNVVGAVENDPYSVESYCINHPDVDVVLADIRTLHAEDLRARLRLDRGGLALLAGCSPCQGFSTLRTYNRVRPARDPRNDLVLEFMRFVEAFVPQAIMMENVPGLVDDERFWRLNERLGELGYACDHRVLDAADYAVPQRRRRVIMLGGRFGPITFPRPARRKVTVHDAIAGLPHPRRAQGDALHNLIEHRTPGIRTLIRSVPSDGGGRRDLEAEEQLTCHLMCDGFKDIYGRMPWDTVAPTITSGCSNPSKGRFLHPSQNRAITPREAALLQTFPRRYYISLGRGKQGAAAQIGNALPPEFIRRIARPIRHYLEQLLA